MRLSLGAAAPSQISCKDADGDCASSSGCERASAGGVGLTSNGFGQRPCLTHGHARGLRKDSMAPLISLLVANRVVPFQVPVRRGSVSRSGVEIFALSNFSTILLVGFTSLILLI